MTLFALTQLRASYILVGKYVVELLWQSLGPQSCRYQHCSGLNSHVSGMLIIASS